MRANILIVLTALMVFSSVAWAEQAQMLTLPEAINMALKNNISLQISAQEVQEADAERLATMGRFGPIFRTEGNILFWDEAYDLDLMEYLKISKEVQRLLNMAVGELPPLQFHDDVSADINVTIIQPITPMYSVAQGYRARSEAEEAYRSIHLYSGQEVTFLTIEAYYRVLKVMRLRQLAQEAVDTIVAHVKQAQLVEAEGFIDRTDVLTAEVALAEAQEKLIRAESGLKLSKSALAHILGLPVNTEVEVMEKANEELPVFSMSLEQAQNLAIQYRDDLAALGHQVRAVQALEKLAWWNMTPQIAAVGRYQHSEGNLLHQEDEAFAGLTLQWNFWEWGRTYNEGRAAEARTRQIKLRQQEVMELIRLQVKQKFLEMESAQQRLVVATIAEERARENLRITQLSFQESMAASVDVLDAQTRLTQAGSNLVSARYDLLTAIASLRLAIGESPWHEGSPLSQEAITGDES